MFSHHMKFLRLQLINLDEKSLKSLNIINHFNMICAHNILTIATDITIYFLYFKMGLLEILIHHWPIYVSRISKILPNFHFWWTIFFIGKCENSGNIYNVLLQNIWQLTFPTVIITVKRQLTIVQHFKDTYSKMYNAKCQHC